MTAESILKNTDTSLKQRQQAAQLLLNHPAQIESIINIITHPQEFSVIATMVTEVLSRKNIEKIEPYLPQLIQAGKLYNDASARRGLARIYGLAVTRYNKDEIFISTKLKNTILELSFSWLISGEKTAEKVFSMQNIFDLRAEEDWIAPELRGILEKEIATESAGYKSRAKKILRKL